MNKLRTLAATAALLLFAGCSSTRLYGPNGHKQFETSADIKGLAYRGADGTTLTAEEINHSNVTGKVLNWASNTMLNGLAFLATGGVK